ncbi:cupin domain-containing protein [Candidatus Cyanaurora vandensis]|uniref:cupin domain-containing protein n=1 Tax=Candidatus Cyanaurora vandensis TaxID=2714958 RepID=UPI00257D5FBE|nr:cupin domain-containing protein [Candidatus Cyanaurora vandensis]
MTETPHLLKAEAIQALPETERIHPVDPEAVRHTRSLGDVLGLTRLGVHLVRLTTGQKSAAQHFHHQEEEFIYILQGRGLAQIGDQETEAGAGDFLGFPAPSLPHALINPFAEDLIYLTGGERREVDVCDYPQAHRRLLRFRGQRQYLDLPPLGDFI